MNELIFFSSLCQIVRKTGGPTMPKEDEPKGLIAPIKEHLALAAEAVSPANLSKQVSIHEEEFTTCASPGGKDAHDVPA